MWTITKTDLEIVRKEPASNSAFEDHKADCRCAAGKVIHLILKEPLKIQDKQGSWNYTENFNQMFRKVTDGVGVGFMVFQVYDINRKDHEKALDNLVGELEKRKLLTVI